MSCGNSFQQEKQEPWLNFNPGLALAGFQTTGPRGPFLESPGNFSGLELYFKIKIYRMVV